MCLRRLFKTRGVEETFLQENVNWALLRGFGASRVAATTALMPFVGYVILYNSQFADLFGGFGGLLEKQPSAAHCPQYLSFFNKLNLVYLGLFTIGVSALIFKAAAPRELKLYQDTNQFIDYERENLTARRVRSMYRTVKYRRLRIANELKERAKWLDNDVAIAKASTEFAGNKNEDVILDLMRCYFQTQDRHYRRGAAIMCMALLAVGCIVLAVPSLLFTSQRA